VAEPIEEDAALLAADAPRLVIGADAVALLQISPAGEVLAEPEEGETAEGRGAAGGGAIAAEDMRSRDSSPPESLAAVDKENTPPGKHPDGVSPQLKAGSPAAGGGPAATAAVDDAVADVVGSTSCSPDRGAPAGGGGSAGTRAVWAGADAVGGGAAKEAPPDAGSAAVSANAAKSGDRRGAFISMNVFCNPLYSTA
jgi:hypothetical protein